jgi:hypothetical protein
MNAQIPSSAGPTTVVQVRVGVTATRRMGRTSVSGSGAAGTMDPPSRSHRPEKIQER